MQITRQYTDAEVADRLDEVGAHLDLDEYDIARGVLAEAAKRLRSGASFQAGRKQMAEEAMRACNERASAYDILVNTQAVMGCDDCLSAIRSLATPTEGKT